MCKCIYIYIFIYIYIYSYSRFSCWNLGWSLWVFEEWLSRGVWFTMEMCWALEKEDLTEGSKNFQWELWEHTAPLFENLSLHAAKREQSAETDIYIYNTLYMYICIHIFLTYLCPSFLPFQSSFQLGSHVFKHHQCGPGESFYFAIPWSATWRIFFRF